MSRPGRIDESGLWTAGGLFLGFAILISSRDLIADSLFHEHLGMNSVDIADFVWVLCLVVASISGVQLLITGRMISFSKKLARRDIGLRAGLLGILAIVIYAVTFYMIKKMGAGLFNVVDYGLAPLITAALGILIRKEFFRRELILAFGAYFWAFHCFLRTRFFLEYL